MKHLVVISMLILFPLCSMAQSEWEVPDQVNNTKEELLKQKKLEEKAAKKQQKALEKARKNAKNDAQFEEKAVPQGKIKEEDRPYLAGVVPEKNGKVVFSLDENIPNKSAQEIYDIVYKFLGDMTKGEQQINSRIALVNKKEHMIAATFTEWLIFSNNFLSLDRSEFNYTIIASCSDEHLNMTIERISYEYEKGTPTELTVTAENFITDKKSLNKKKNGFLYPTGKFRKSTVDRVKQIFKSLSDTLR